MSDLYHAIELPGVRIPSNIWSAPLAGYSNHVYRKMARRYGAGFSVTEMTSVEGLIREDIASLRYADVEEDPKEQVSVQIFGGPYPEHYYQAAQILKERLGVRIIGINFGCPVRKVTCHCAGSALLEHPAMMADLVRAVKAAGVLCEAKIRTGYHSPNFTETIPALRAAGADVITMHARTRNQKYEGQADWSLFRQAKGLCGTVPFIANGDIQTPEDVQTVLMEFGADGVMLGRAAIGKPFLFQQIQDYLLTGTYRKYDKEEVKPVLMEYAILNASTRGEITHIRAALLRFLAGFEGAPRLRRSISAIRTPLELETLLRAW